MKRRSWLIVCSLELGLVVLCVLGILASYSVRTTGSAAQPTPWQERLPESLAGEVDAGLPRALVEGRWHDAFRGSVFWDVRFTDLWDASYFFRDDKGMINLCEAISDGDLKAMERAIADGADVNYIGRERMTPLYWAFHVDKNPEPFLYLLRKGADPNVIALIDGDRWHRAVPSGCAVTHLVTTGRYNRLFGAVFAHGGDPNLPAEDYVLGGVPPLFRISVSSCPDAYERVQLLIDKGVDLGGVDRRGKTLVQRCLHVDTDKSLRVCLMALENGAAYRNDQEASTWLEELHGVLSEKCRKRAEIGEDSPALHQLLDWVGAQLDSPTSVTIQGEPEN